MLKPGGFQDHIDIEIYIDEHEVINEAILMLDREWIGNFESLNPFGKDIAKSFIDAFLPEIPNDEFRDSLITSLWNMKGAQDVVICIDKVVKRWEEYNLEVRDFLDVYRDMKNEARKVIDDYEIIMGNVKIDNKKLLKILISFIKR
ncbi:MAG: hypothetical protein ACFFBP_21055 [Promethearchaeota archaeon]